MPGPQLGRPIRPKNQLFLKAEARSFGSGPRPQPQMAYTSRRHIHKRLFSRFKLAGFFSPAP